MQDPWMTRRAEEIQSSDEPALLTESSLILNRWAEHFGSILSLLVIIFEAAIDILPQNEAKVAVDLPPTLPEAIRTVHQMTVEKVPVSDVTPTKAYKYGAPA
ncbi:hypothetical protein SprV_0401394400 [Sparganum proliferum]